MGFDLGHDLNLGFLRSIMEFPISQPKVVRLPRNEKQTYRLNSKASNVTIRFDLGHDLNLGFLRSIMEFPISQPKVVRLSRNEKQTYRLSSRLQMLPMGLTLTIILTFEIWRSNVTLNFDHTWLWPWIFIVEFWNSCISEWEGRFTLHKGCGSRSFMTMTVTIWWLRSGVWIYQIVTGVTSVVGVPSTHLVGSDNGRRQGMNQYWNIVNWTLRNKRQWNLHQNSYIFFQENAFGNVVGKMAATLSRLQCVKLVTSKLISRPS